MMRHAGAVSQAGSAVFRPAGEPLVAGGRGNAKMTAKRTDVRPVLRGEQNKLGT
ncbi:hypothetical protein D3C72_2371690 [compost metagenome]